MQDVEHCCDIEMEEADIRSLHLRSPLLPDDAGDEGGDDEDEEDGGEDHNDADGGALVDV